MNSANHSAFAYTRSLVDSPALRQTPWNCRSLTIQDLTLARSRALRRFSEQFPHWVEHFFDETFVLQKVTPLLWQHQLHGERITAEEVGLAWWMQCSSRGRAATSRQLADIMPVALHFLKLFDEELAALRMPAPLY
jgi:hypothetical protein